MRGASGNWVINDDHRLSGGHRRWPPGSAGLRLAPAPVRDTTAHGGAVPAPEERRPMNGITRAARWAAGVLAGLSAQDLAGPWWSPSSPWPLGAAG